MLLINDKEPIKILNKDIQAFGEDLAKFAEVYRKYIYIEDDKDLKSIELLEQVAMLIKQRRYSELLDKNIQIIFDEPMMIDLPF